MTFHSVEGPVLAQAKLAWLRKRGWRRWEMGIQFIEPGEVLRAALSSTARAAASNEVVKPSLEEARRPAA